MKGTALIISKNGRLRVALPVSRHVVPYNQRVSRALFGKVGVLMLPHVQATVLLSKGLNKRLASMLELEVELFQQH